MSQFSRRARWLNFLFPTSVAPRPRDPDRFSDDVSLVQQFDGGGFGLSAVDDGDWWHFEISATQDADDFVVFSVPEGFLFRWMAADAVRLDGLSPTGHFDLQAAGGGFSGIISVTPTQVISITPIPNVPNTPIVGPFSDIRFVYNGGGGTTRIMARVYGALAPIGSVFHV